MYLLQIAEKVVCSSLFPFSSPLEGEELKVRGKQPFDVF
jgi:hypothetical protein